MKLITANLLGLLAVLAATSIASADPLPGRDLTKFSQKPMNATSIVNTTGTVSVYGGHDELSTAYGIGTAAQPPVDYQGRFMADDFADNLSSPIVHVKWWGSYHQDVINPNMPVNRFLISFENDVPAGPAPSFSRPTDVGNFNQTVLRSNVLTPGSGTFTEKVIRGKDPVVGESLYEYNAELNLGKSFAELKDTVYWLKIVAMVDIPAAFPQPFSVVNPPPNATQWGWHNRDYTIQNLLASPNVTPGEQQVGTVPGGAPIWHFQDDAVTGDVRILPNSAAGGLLMPLVFQPDVNMQPTNYLNLADGPGPIPGTNWPGIGTFSKDLAFEIYTVVPEPATAGLMGVALAAIGLRRKRARVA